MDAVLTMRRMTSRLGLWLGVIALLAWLLLPLLITVSTSLKTRGDVFADPDMWPDHPSLDAYWRVLERPGFQTALWNSTLIGFGTCVLTLALAVPSAYAFARFRFRGRHLLLLLMLLPRLVPSVGIMLPLYQLAAAAGMIDKRLTLVIVYSGMLLPLAVWLMVGFFQAIPQEIEEAASVDGATMWQRLRLIVLPLTLPALVTIAVLAFREAWNEFQLVLVLTTSADKRTLPYELYATQGLGLSDLPMESAFAILTILPLILVYVRLERYVVQGIVSGAVK